MANSMQKAFQISDVATILLSHNSGWSEDTIETLKTIKNSVRNLIADFEKYQEESREHLRSYLNHNAMAPLTLIIGYSELLLMDYGCNDDTECEINILLKNLCSTAYELQQELVALRTSLTEAAAD